MIQDEILMAYADGELNAAKRKEVEQAAASDPATAMRLMDHVALRARMSKAFAEVLDEPVPSRLSTLAAGNAPTAAVIDLAAARAARAPKARPVKVSWPLGGAMAACLAVGVLVGVGLETLRPAPLLTSRDGAVVAAGALAKALSTQLAVNQNNGAPIRVGLSIRTASGNYCRTFRIDQQAAVAGLACRDPAAWSVKMAVAINPTPASADYRTASSDSPEPLARLVETLSVGNPLDASGEAEALHKRWLK